MEGLIPLIYNAIVQLRSSGQASMAAPWFHESPTASYVQLPGDSGRFQSSEIQFLEADSVLCPSSYFPITAASQLIHTANTQSPLCPPHRGSLVS
ncbi:hypothetical protein L1049_011732 [Liquidambar formosana]|uniref:Uncharacterized protein n=1 Tax=Liquidambar formosana TaxID=63359 RepID=A0AAP0RX41_LIQFO